LGAANFIEPAVEPNFLDALAVAWVQTVYIDAVAHQSFVFCHDFVYLWDGFLAGRLGCFNFPDRVRAERMAVDSGPWQEENDAARLEEDFTQRPARRPSQLPESLHKRFNAYALAASAAGVGLLALAHSAEAKIVYTKTHHVITNHERIYYVDLNHGGVTDFTLSIYTGCTGNNSFASLLAVGAQSNEVQGADGLAYALPRGARIASKVPLLGRGVMAYAFAGGGNTGSRGDWVNVANRYLGLKFSIRAKIHYGWARLTVKATGASITATLTGYAYETIPNKPIIAGETKGRDAITVGPDSLGALAAGRK
jgi:hypothetical protein